MHLEQTENVRSVLFAKIIFQDWSSFKKVPCESLNKGEIVRAVIPRNSQFRSIHNKMVPDRNGVTRKLTRRQKAF